LRSVLRGERPRVHGDGGDLRDQVHARDAASAFCLALASDSASGLFNVADGERHSVGELARIAMKLAGMSGEPESAPRVKPRRDYHMSIERARRELGFRPSTDIESGMREQLEWLQKGTRAASTEV
jgi:nucleoside-diphosphate-sugar epimerase